HRHYEIYINPYPTETSDEGDERVCLVTTREQSKDGLYEGLPLKSWRRNALTEFALTIPFVRRVVVFLFASWPKWGPKLLATGLRNQERDEFTSFSFNVLNVGSANLLPVLSSEAGVAV